MKVATAQSEFNMQARTGLSGCCGLTGEGLHSIGDIMKIGDKVKCEFIDAYNKNGVFYHKGEIVMLEYWGPQWFKHRQSWNEAHPNLIPASIVRPLTN